MKNSEREIEVVTYETDIVWSDGGIEVVYCHESDNFELWITNCFGGWECIGEFDKSANAVQAAKGLERYEG
jgi:hypothetical protein